MRTVAQLTLEYESRPSARAVVEGQSSVAVLDRRSSARAETLSRLPVVEEVARLPDQMDCSGEPARAGHLIQNFSVLQQHCTVNTGFTPEEVELRVAQATFAARK